MDSWSTATKVRRFIFVATVLYLANRFRKFLKWQRELAARYPGPPVSPLTGNIDFMIESGGFNEELFERLHSKYGDVVRFFIFPNMMNLSLVHPDHVAELYRKGRDRPLETYMFLWYLGDKNLMFQHGPIVKQMRMKYGEKISDRHSLEKVHEVSLRQFRAAVDKWSTGAPFDLFRSLGPEIYDVMGQVMFDSPWLTTEMGREVYKLHKQLIEGVNRWLLWAAFPVGPWFHPGYVKYVMTVRKWHALVGSLIEKRAQEMKADPKKYANDMSAIGMILTAKDESGKPFFSKERGISTMCGFLNGAYDTTHSTSFWMMYHLSKYPEQQTKIVDEIARVLPGVSEPGVDDLRKCEYMHAFIMESMRMRATVPVNQRMCLDEDMEIAGYLIPKGTNVNIPMGKTFKDPRFYGADVHIFRPERFLGDSPQAETARKSWMAFGNFTRMCIGFTFALTEMKAMLFTFLTRSTISLEDPNEDGAFMIEAGVNQPKKHFNFVFKQRDLRKMREEENLRWWVEQTQALDKIKGGSVATTA